ncbi:hypothetical protein GQR58_000066 [Nymphon striatum]|nr:hypothetical protein GQR58_000066 [Nymphon striatum]
MISLHFENGSMRLGRETLDLVWRDRETRVETLVKDNESSRVEKHEWHQAVIEDFVDAIHERRAPFGHWTRSPEVTSVDRGDRDIFENRSDHQYPYCHLSRLARVVLSLTSNRDSG